MRAVLLAKATDTNCAGRRSPSVLAHRPDFSDAPGGVADHRGPADHQQAPQVGVARLGDAALALLAAARILLRRQPEPGGEVPRGAEAGRVAHGGDDGAAVIGPSSPREVGAMPSRPLK